MVRQLATVQDPAHTELRIQEVLMLPAMKEFQAWWILELHGSFSEGHVVTVSVATSSGREEVSWLLLMFYPPISCQILPGVEFNCKLVHQGTRKYSLQGSAFDMEQQWESSMRSQSKQVIDTLSFLKRYLFLLAS